MSKISHVKTWIWLRKGNLKRETESLLIAEQNNAIRTNYVKAKIDKMQPNSWCRLCGNRDDTINNIINKCCKFVQREYKTRHNWVGKVIYWKQSKKFLNDHANKWYIHNPESVLENEMQKVLWDFEIQTDHLISVRWLDWVIVNKKRTCQIVNFAVPVDHRVKQKESKKRDKYVDLARKLKKLWNMKVTVIPIVNGALSTVTKGFVHGLENMGIRGQVETIQIIALPLETWRDLLSLRLHGKTIC